MVSAGVTQNLNNKTTYPNDIVNQIVSNENVERFKDLSNISTVDFKI